MKTELCKIMTDQGSDKGNGWHNYTEYYYEIFKDIRDKPLNIFELGLGPKPGASLQGWKNFFPNAKIYGADIDKNLLFEEERIKTFYCDQKNPFTILEMWDNSELENLEFDIIIDDGFHEFGANFVFFENSIKKLKKGGIYIIEDLNNNTFKAFTDLLPVLISKYPHLHFELKRINNPKNQYDNNIFIARYFTEEEKKSLQSEELFDELDENSNRKIIDCFTFYNEFEILELRLTELYNIVDYFVLIEADQTHKGEQKPLFYQENKERFAKWADKIIYQKVSFPENLDVWGREKFQRNSFMPILYSLKLKENDLILITDVDEIPDPKRINDIKKNNIIDNIYKLEMDTYFGSLWNKQINVKWYHPKIVNWSTLKSITPDSCRLNFSSPTFESFGWHFTYFGGPHKISNKLKQFAHQEYNTDNYTDENYILERVKQGKDLFGETRTYQKINPEKNPHLPDNWRILKKFEEFYDVHEGEKKNLTIIFTEPLTLEFEEAKEFIELLRDKFKQKSGLYVIPDGELNDNEKNFLYNYMVKILQK